MAPSSPRVRAVACAAIPVLVFGLIGCAPASDSTNSQNGATSTDRNANPQSTSEYDDWYLKFAKCMRGKGVDVPDTPPSTMSLNPDDGFSEAAPTCIKEVGNPPTRNLGTPRSEDTRRKIAQCYRDSGYDVADPKPGMPAEMPVDAPPEIVDKCLAAAN